MRVAIEVIAHHKVNETLGGDVPVRHSGDGFESKDESSIRVRASILPATKGGREELAGRAVGFGDDGGEAAVS